MEESPADLVTCSDNVFGNKLEPDKNVVLESLREEPKDKSLFKVTMGACLQAVVDVLERQYTKYFQCELTEKLKAETKSVRSHSIDAEDIMGMFGALKKKAPNATLCYLSSKMRAQKNKTVGYLDCLIEEGGIQL